MKIVHSVLTYWTGILSRDTLGVQHVRSACPDMEALLFGLSKRPNFTAICVSFLVVRSEYPLKMDIYFVQAVCLAIMADQNRLTTCNAKCPLIADVQKGLS